MKKYGREYTPIDERKKLHDSLEAGVTKVLITDGRNRGKRGIIKSVSYIRNGGYSRNHTYHSYFSLRVDLGKKTVSTSCNYIKIIN